MTSAEQSGEPSAEELQAYLGQLRDADAREIVVQAYTMLGTGAEVKLGRRDARVLIDAMAGLAQAAGPALGEELATGMAGGVRQLQLAQVEAERQAGAQAGADPGAAAPAPPPAAPAATPPPAGTPQPGPGADQPMTDRLWIPGRGQAPPPRR